MPKPDHIGTCADCAFFVPQWISDRDAGYCHAGPPIPVSTDAGIVSEWAKVRNADWCGHWADPTWVSAETVGRLSGDCD